MSIRSQLSFNRQQQLGILSLLAIILGLLLIFYFVKISNDEIIDTNSPEIVALQKEMDSLRTIELANRIPKKYSFNPNFITDYKGYTLGMSPQEIDRLLAYRKENKWINSIQDFKRVTQLSDSLLDEISPYFKFPEWVNNPKAKSTSEKYSENKGFISKSFKEKIDLNLATEEELQRVSGVGPALSQRIVAYRKRLNGFVEDSQVFEVYGLQEDVANRLLNLFTVKTPKLIQKIAINTASASDLSTIPGISFELGKKMWEYRVLHEKVHSFEELAKIEGLTPRKLITIQLYLSID